MLQKTLIACKIAMCCAIALMCVTIAIFTYQLKIVTAQLTNTIHLANKDLVKVNDLLVHVDQTANAARLASNKESAYLDQWNKQISETMVNVNGVLQTTQKTISATAENETEIVSASKQTLLVTQTAIQGLSPVEENATAELASLKATTDNLNKLVSDPQITATIANVNSTTKHIDDTAADVQQYVHSITHPTILHEVWNGMLDVAHVFNPL